MKKYLLLLPVLALLLAGCNVDKIDKEHSVITDPVYDTQSPIYHFEQYLRKRFVAPYNVEMIYRWRENATVTSYNLVPCRLGRVDSIAHLTHYLWFDLYDQVVDTTFLKIYGPRMIQYIGSKGYNSNGTATLGTADGGIKIILYGMNELHLNNINELNQYAFHVMHHEFSHILHQTKTYPKDFEFISMGMYDPDQWQNQKDTVVHRRGFVSPYASGAPREDFVEVIATYVTNYVGRPEQAWHWDEILEDAAKGSPYPGDTLTGADIILNKLEICRAWLKDKYAINIDSLRNEVMRRQVGIETPEKLDSIMNELYIADPDQRVPHDWDFSGLDVQ